MSQTAPAITTQTPEKAVDFSCSCGRTFAHEISLKRHRWVTGHAESDPADSQTTAVEVAAGPSVVGALTIETPLLPGPFEAVQLEDAYATAMDTLLAKVREQEARERRQRLQEKLNLVGEFATWMGSNARQLGRDALAAGQEASQRGLRGLALLGRSLAVMMLMLTLLFGGLSVGRALSRPTPTGPPAEAQGHSLAAATSRQLGGAVQTPVQIVKDFYRSLDSHDCQAAYAHLSADWQRQLAYGAFESGYSQTDSLTCKVHGVQRLSANRSRVSFELETVEAAQVANYVGSYDLVKTSKGWQIDRGQLVAE